MVRYLSCVVAPMFTLACASDVACDCLAPGIDVNIPTSLAPDVTSITASDRACNGLTPTCTKSDGSGRCTNYHLAPTTYGNCHIVVTLASRTFTSDVRVVQKSGCCAGYYADPLAAGTVEVSSHGGVFH